MFNSDQYSRRAREARAAATKALRHAESEDGAVKESLRNRNVAVDGMSLGYIQDGCLVGETVVFCGEVGKITRVDFSTRTENEVNCLYISFADDSVWVFPFDGVYLELDPTQSMTAAPAQLADPGLRLVG